MKNSTFIRMSCFFLSLVFAFGVMVMPVSAAYGEDGLEHKDNYGEMNKNELEAYLKADSYLAYIEKYEQLLVGQYGADKSQWPQTEKVSVDLSAPVVDEETENSSVPILGLDDWNKYAGAGKTELYQAGSVYLPNTGSTTWEINVPTEGLYYIGITYYSVEGTVSSIERRLSIDDVVPFAEARYLTMSKSWSYAYYPDPEKPDEPFAGDVLGNSLTPEITQTPVWRTYYCTDSSGYYTGFYQFYVSAGKHEIKLDAEREACILGALELVPVNDASVQTPSYQEYLASLQNVPYAGKDAVVTLQAETPYMVSDSAVYMTNDRTSALTTPSAPNKQLYNVIGANSYNSVGQWAAYTFTVEDEGLYNLVMRYKQSSLEGMYICRAIKLWSSDGEYGLGDGTKENPGTPTAPFQEAYNTRFDYSDEWQVSALGDDENDFLFHFKPDVTYVLYLEVSLGSLADQLSRVKQALSVINDCYLRILQLTGASPDKNRDYYFSERMPDVLYNLCWAAVELSEIKVYFEDICNTTGQHLSTLELVANLLAEMGTNEYEIPAKLSSLKNYLGTLGTWLNSSCASSLTVDYIQVSYVETEDDLPKADGNFFEKFWFEISSFFYSFIVKYDQMGVRNEEDLSEAALDVWLASGRDQSKIWRSLIDSDFSDYCQNTSLYCQENGINSIPLALKLVTAGTLLPSILANRGPDVYMGLDSTTTINYAIRGAVEPIISDVAGEGFEDAQYFFTGEADAAKVGETGADDNFHQAAINTVELLDKVYGVPMTMNFSMMFYRMDILVELGVGLPETWTDMLSLLPVLQANNLAAGLGAKLTTSQSTEGLNGTLEMMMYQRGANMWHYVKGSDEYYGEAFAGAKIGLDSNESLDVFEFYCRMYTDYSFPYQYDGANRFRTGEMPIIIGDYVGMYNQLVVFATEIAGLWEFTSVPGTHSKTDGSLNYDAIATISNLVIPHSENRTDATRMQAWEFIKWNASEDAQASYGNRMVALVGPSAKYATANRHAIAKLSWTTKENAAIQDQLAHLSSIRNYPGSYIIARYLNFAFLDAYNNGEDAVEAMNKYISAINTELYRKRTEFADEGIVAVKGDETPEDHNATKQ